MKKLVDILNVVLVGVLCFLLTFFFTKRHTEQNFPKEIFESEYNRISNLSGGVNKLVHFPDGNNYMYGTLTSPDALFSMMSYDLSEKPVGLYLPLPASPWAITIYDENCNPFYSLDERNFARTDLQVILYNEGQQAPDHESVVKVKSPGTKGIIVTRLITGSDDQNMLAELRKEMKTGLIK